MTPFCIRDFDSTEDAEGSGDGITNMQIEMEQKRRVVVLKRKRNQPLVRR